jgi:hypothetical protein
VGRKRCNLGKALGIVRANVTVCQSAAMASLGADLVADQTFGCPRCGDHVTERFYGPCATCLDQLLATQGGAGGDVVAAAYEPKMNVTPNAVATKD